MTLNRRLSSKPPPGNPSPGGTLDRARPLPTHSNLKTLMAVDGGLIKLVNDARKWLELRGWILAADPYDQTKLVNILTTAALTSKQPELKNATLAVAFLLDANITDQVSSTLADAIATRTTERLERLVGKLGTTADFLAANDTKAAKSTLALKAMANKLGGQRVHWDARTVLIRFDGRDEMAPEDLSPTGTLKLHNDLNKMLQQIYVRALRLCKAEDWEIDMVTLRMSGSTDLGGSAALGESLLGRRDPLALATKHLKAFWALMACADS
ncbi:hypothetical protein C0989_006658, partial [Termitomyces sp. Mn162]